MARTTHPQVSYRMTAEDCVTAVISHAVDGRNRAAMDAYNGFVYGGSTERADRIRGGKVDRAMAKRGWEVRGDTVQRIR